MPPMEFGKVSLRSVDLLAAWENFIALETELNHINIARSIYKRYHSKRFPESSSEVICHSWLHFEKEFGSLEVF